MTMTHGSPGRPATVPLPVAAVSSAICIFGPFHLLQRFSHRQECLCYRSAAGRTLHVPAELVAHAGEHFLGEGVILARTEARVERSRKHVAGNSLLDGGHDGPAAFAG